MMTVAAPPEQVQALICGDSMVIGSVREITNDEGKWDHNVLFDIAEMSKSLKDVAPDAKPFFAEVLVLHRGHSRKSDGSKNIEYGDESVKDTARLLPGTIAYTGHPDPAKVEFEYRTPVGKYVASRVEERDVKDFGRVPCVIGKVYVSAAATDLRTHLREGLAGPVSIYGAAMFRAVNGQRTNATVGMSRLKSVDFCNPGTPGVAGAGVTGLVQEIAPAAPPGAKSMSDPVARLTRRQIETDYPEVVAAIIREETDSYEKTVKEITARAETAEGQVKTLTTEKTTLEGKVTEMTKAHGEAKTRAETAEGKVTEMQKAAKVTAVRDATLVKVNERITAAKADAKTSKVEVPILEMAAKGLSGMIDASILPASDDDKNTLAVNAALAKFDAKVADVREMAKSFGAPGGVRDVSEVARGGTVADGGGDEEKRMASLFPSIAKQNKAAEAAAGKK